MARYLRRLSLIVCSFWIGCALQREYRMGQPLKCLQQNDLQKCRVENWRKFMTETLETLSMPNQKLDVEYFHRVLNFTDKAVIATPCGWSKTLRIAEYIATRYWDGVLYVAERKAQLDEMQ